MNVVDCGLMFVCERSSVVAETEERGGVGGGRGGECGVGEGHEVAVCGRVGSLCSFSKRERV